MKLVRDEISSIPRFEAERAILFPEAEFVSTFPEYFENRNFDEFSVRIYDYQYRETAEKALQMCRVYVENHDKIADEYGGCGLYFFSKTKGTGKTYLSTIVGAELSRRGHRVRWYSMPNLLQEIKTGFDRESGYSSSEIINQAKNAEMLMLDDVGVEKQTAWVNETIFNILDYRLMQQKPTFFTSNLEPGDLAYDERIKDRIRRMTETIPLPEDGVRKRLATTSKLGQLLRG